MPPVPKPPASRRPANRTLAIIAGAIVIAAALIGASVVLTGGDSESSAPPSLVDTGADTETTPATGSTGTGTTASTDTTAGTGTTTPETTGGSTPSVTAFLAGIPQQGTVLGSPKAGVRMLQYEDLQCPVCQRYTHDAFSDIVTQYVKTGKITIDFRGLAFIGEDSEKALRIALAAGEQNKLWNVVELFYANQGDENGGWVTDALVDKILAAVPGLDAARVKADAQSAAITDEISTVATEAATRGVQGTPWFYVGTGLNEPDELTPQSFTVDAFAPTFDRLLAG